MTTSLAQLVKTAAAGTQGSIRVAGQLMSLMEDQPQRLAELLHAMGPQRREPRLLLGVTGAPGSGKSTLVDRLISEYRQRQPEQRVGVIAVDPSSPFTGGAVLGDRVRMMNHANDPLVYVRSLASRGHVGGLSLGVKGMIHVMGLIGCDVVIIETVGVGQSEVEIAQVADDVIIVLAPGQGDSIQLLKAGLMEIGDWFVVNKADLPTAVAFHASVQSALNLSQSVKTAVNVDQEDSPQKNRLNEPPGAVLVSALDNQGIGELVDQVQAKASLHHDQRIAYREHALTMDVQCALLHEIRHRLLEALAMPGAEQEYVKALLSGEVSVEASADALLKHVTKDLRTH